MITKRLLGIGFIVTGTLGIAAMFIRDLLGATQFEGVGPAQRLALLVGGAVILVGLSLLPLGNRPA
jgi:hypothetical protein